MGVNVQAKGTALVANREQTAQSVARGGFPIRPPHLAGGIEKETDLSGIAAAEMIDLAEGLAKGQIHGHGNLRFHLRHRGHHTQAAVADSGGAVAPLI